MLSTSMFSTLHGRLGTELCESVTVCSALTTRLSTPAPLFYVFSFFCVFVHRSVGAKRSGAPKGSQAPRPICSMCVSAASRQLFELRGSDGVVHALQTCARHNLAPAAGRSTVLVVSGPAGSGKTRVGFEALCMSSGLYGDLLHKLKQTAGCSVLTILLFIDFNNGCRRMGGVDGNMDLNLGVHLAARALACGVQEA